MEKRQKKGRTGHEGLSCLRVSTKASTRFESFAVCKTGIVSAGRRRCGRKAGGAGSLTWQNEILRRKTFISLPQKSGRSHFF